MSNQSVATNWWVSWYGAGAFEYHGPWWITGHEVGGRERATFCAAVQASSADAARDVIIQAHDSTLPVIEWRFADERPSGWAPWQSDRFPRADWMQWPTEVPS